MGQAPSDLRRCRTPFANFANARDIVPAPLAYTDCANASWQPPCAEIDAVVMQRRVCSGGTILPRDVVAQRRRIEHFGHRHLATLREHGRALRHCGVTRCQRSLWKWMMNGGSSVIVIVSNDSASCSEKLQRSKRSGSMVGSRMSGTMSIAMRAKYCRISRRRWTPHAARRKSALRARNPRPARLTCAPRFETQQVQPAADDHRGAQQRAATPASPTRQRSRS